MAGNINAPLQNFVSPSKTKDSGMQEIQKSIQFDVLDYDQLKLIESVHRGFLYQHLYAVGCLFLAQSAGVEDVTVELDEDIEINSEQGRVYVQVKTRSKPITPSEISGILERFNLLRGEHLAGKRKGNASFIIVANQKPTT
jgi:hypothetical protein